MKKLFTFVFLLLGSTAFAQQLIEPTYRNPVIAMDLPDPTVIRVGSDYYAAGTTTNFVPNYPLFHSTDLVNWNRIGAVFNSPPDWLVGDFWAPELYYNNGTYFVYYTARRKKDNITCIGVATTKDIRKGFTDHGPMVEWGNEAIDAYIFKDDDNKMYISWKAYGLDPSRPIEILASQISDDGLKLVGEHFTLTPQNEGWVERGDEGQCMVKHNGYYYMLYSIGGCCDNRCDYRVHVSRSKNIRGPWVQQPGPALLEGNEVWRCTGHGTLVKSADNRYFYMYHAYSGSDFEFMGRQALLDELLWDNTTNWPYFKYGNTPSVQAAMPFANTSQQRNFVFFDNFSDTDQAKHWQWDMKSGKPTISRKANELTISASDQVKSPLMSFYGINPQRGNYTMETTVDKVTGFGGLCVYGNQENQLAWGLSGSEVKLIQLKNGIKTELFNKVTPASGKVYFRIESLVGRLFRFYWSTDQKEWYTCFDVNIDGTYIPRWGTGLRIGLVVEKSSTFSEFKVVYK